MREDGSVAMEHIVQFGINIDDEQIRKTVSKNVEKYVLDECKQRAFEELGLVGRYGYADIPNSEIAREITDRVLEEYGERIVEGVTSKVAERLLKRRTFADRVELEVIKAASESGGE